MNRRLFFVLAQILLLLAASNGQTPPTHKPPERQKPLAASWDAILEKNLGITQQAFQEMGLSKLTFEQEMKLIAWAEQREQQAKDSVPTTSFTCGRTGESFPEAKPESYEKVRVYVNASSGGADEIISAVRQRLRAMNGTEVVYSSEEADLTVHLVAIATKTTGGYQTGNAISVVVSQPCVCGRWARTRTTMRAS